MTTDAAVDQRAELEEERDFLLRSLDDLDAEHDDGELDDDDYRALKDDYTARAAVVLRRLQRLDAPTDAQKDGAGHDRASAAPPKLRAPTARRPRWPLLLSVAGTLALAGSAGYLVTQTSGERLPGQEMTAGVDLSARARLQQAIDLDNAGQLVEAAKLYDAVLAEDPENVIALTRRGWVLGRSGRQAGNTELLQAGLGYLEQATEIDPSFADAHAFKGLVLGALGRSGEAGCEFRLWLAIAPITDEMRPAIEGVLDEATKQAGGTLPECPKPPVPVPVGAEPTTPPATATAP
jgi:tetratricopeptide (TPR) repeat protein